MAVAQDDEEVVVDTTVVADSEESSYQDEEKEVVPVDPELRRVPDTTVNRLQKDDAFIYANDPAYWTKAKKEEEEDDRKGRRSKGFGESTAEFLSDSTVRTIIYIILGVILVLIIYRIVVVNNLFMTPASRKRIEESQEPETEIDDNDLDTKVRKAIQEKNYRLAIRFMYLKTLRSLNEKGWIRYHAQGTNNEYINQVHHYGAGNEFRFLTHVYEYVWYGEFSLTEEQFNKVQQNFQHFYNTARL
ncbi:MAG: DUF4129 domain-containing protein [Niastella sp.]|nr:DUF4129 domain-containing protein [Niastella sp.]